MKDANIGVAAHYAAAATNVVSNVACILYRIVLNTGADGATTVYDDPAAATAANTIATIAANSTGVFEYGVHLTNGLVVKLAHNDQDITVVYRKLA